MFVLTVAASSLEADLPVGPSSGTRWQSLPRGPVCTARAAAAAAFQGTRFPRSRAGPRSCPEAARKRPIKLSVKLSARAYAMIGKDFGIVRIRR